MSTLAWIDFTAHNARTNENVRAFSVNHPQAGNLVVIKGVEPAYEASMQGLGFTLTRDGSFVIRAAQLNTRQLRSQVFPALQAREVELSDIDLTDQFLNQGAPARAMVDPGLQFLLNSAQPTDREGLSRYAGPMPSAAAVSLWRHLEDSAQATTQPNGQIHYRGEHQGQAYIVQRRQRLLSDTERVIFHLADNAELLPDLQTSSQAPALFRLSDTVSTQLVEAGGLYGASLNGDYPEDFVPDRHLGQKRAQQALNDSEALEGQLIKAQVPVERTLTLADAQYDTAVSVRHLVDILGGDETNAMLIDLPNNGWISAPEDSNNPAASPNASIRSGALVSLPGLTLSAETRGFTAVGYYREEPLSAELNQSPYIAQNGVALHVRALRRTEVTIERRDTLVNQNRLPEGYEVAYGTGQREGLVSLVHQESGDAITLEGNAWFPGLSDAISALDAPENQPFEIPDETAIDQALSEAFGERETQSVDLPEPLDQLQSFNQRWLDENQVPETLRASVEQVQALIETVGDGAQWTREAPALQGVMDDVLETVDQWLDEELDSASVQSLVSIRESLDARIAPAPEASGTDPALDPENVARMADGANTRVERERRQRAEWEEGYDERMEAIEARQPTWQSFEEVNVLRINDEPFLAVPVSGRKNAREFEIVDVRDRTEAVTVLKKSEVNGWLYRSGASLDETAEVAEPEAVETTAAPAHPGEQILQRLSDSAQGLLSTDDITLSRATANLSDTEQQSLRDYLVDQGAERTETAEPLEYRLLTPESEQLVALFDSGKVRLTQTDAEHFDAEAITRRLKARLDSLNAHATAAVALEGGDRAIYLAENRGTMIEALQEIGRLSDYVRSRGESVSEVIVGQLPDLISLEDPTLTEVMDRTIDEDVSLQIESIELDRAAREASEAAAPEPAPEPEGPIRHLEEEALIALERSGNFEEANIQVVRADRGQGFNVFLGEHLVGRSARADRPSVIAGILGHRRHSTDNTDTLLQEYREFPERALARAVSLDDAFAERVSNVHTLLEKTVPEATNDGGAIQRELEVTDAGLITGASWLVGDTRIVDDLSLSIDELSEEITRTLSTLQQAQADTALEAQGEQTAPVFDSQWPSNPQTFSIESFETIQQAQEALVQGHSIDEYGEEVFIRPSTVGWVIKTRSDGAVVTKGGDPRGGGYERWEAVESASEFWGYLPHFAQKGKTQDAGATESTSTEQGEAQETEQSAATDRAQLEQANQEIPVFALSLQAIDLAREALEEVEPPTGTDTRALDAYRARKAKWENAVEVFETSLATGVDPFEVIDREDLPGKIRQRFESQFAELSPNQLGEHALQARRDRVEALGGDPDAEPAPDELAQAKAQAFTEERDQTEPFMQFGSLRAAEEHLKTNELYQSHEALQKTDGAIVRPRMYPGLNTTTTATLFSDKVVTSKTEAIDLLGDDPDTYSHLIKLSAKRWLVRSHGAGVLAVDDGDDREYYEINPTTEGGFSSFYPNNKSVFYGPKTTEVTRDSLDELIEAMQEAPELAREKKQQEQAQRDQAAARRAEEEESLDREREALSGLTIEETMKLDFEQVKSRAQRKRKAGEEVNAEESTLRRMRADVFSAEDALVEAFDQRDPTLFADHAALFPAAAERLEGMAEQLNQTRETGPAQEGESIEAGATPEATADSSTEEWVNALTGDSVPLTQAQQKVLADMQALARDRREMADKTLVPFLLTGESLYVGVKNDKGKPISVTEVEPDGRVRRSDTSFLTFGFDDRRTRLVSREAFSPVTGAPISEPAEAVEPELVSEGIDEAADDAPPAPATDLFGAPADDLFTQQVAEPTVGTFVIEPGSTEKQFIVSGNALSNSAMSDALEGMGGLYVKKFAGYRFKTTSENRIRQWLAQQTEGGDFQLDERIRSPIELSVGTRLPSGNKVTDIKWSSIFNSVRVDVDKGGSVIAMDLNTDIPGLELSENVTVTNAQAIEEQLSPAQEEGSEEAVEAEPEEQPASNESVSANDAPAEQPAPDEAETDTSRQTRMLRGLPVSRLGENAAGEALYIHDSGLRFCIDTDGTVREETPEVTETGDFIPPSNRADHFKLGEEVAAEASSSANNVVSFFERNNESNEPELSEEEQEAQAQEVKQTMERAGFDDDVMKAYSVAYNNLRDYEEEREAFGEETDSRAFVYRRLQTELNKIEATLANRIVSQGYAANPRVFTAIRDSMETRRQTIKGTASTLVEALVSQSIVGEVHLLTPTIAKTLRRSDAQTLPPAWLHEKLERLNADEHAPTRALVIAKAYGTREEIESMSTAMDSEDIDQRMELARTIEQKYENHRALVELPARISELRKFAEDYVGVSPIPRENNDRQMARLYEALARAQFDIDAMPISDEDKTLYYETPNGYDTAVALAERHGLSIDAGRLFADRVGNLIGQERYDEYMASDEVQVFLAVSDTLKEHPEFGEGLLIETDIHSNGGTHQIAWGAGSVSVGVPVKQDDGQYAVYYSYQTRDGSTRDYDMSTRQVYETLPSAEIIARDTASVMARYRIERVDISKAPRFGQKFGNDELDQYDNAAIAKQIRTDIKEAIKTGALPKGLKVSVRKDGSGINVRVTEVPKDFPMINPEYVTFVEQNPHEYLGRPSRFSHEGRALMEAIEGYADAYNFDNSEPMTDYFNRNYYGSVALDYPLEGQLMAEAKEALANTPSQEDLRNKIFPLLTQDAAWRLHQLYETGFVYVPGREEPITLNDGSTNGFVDHDGRIVEGLDGLDPVFVQAADAIRVGFHLRDLPAFLAEEGQEETQAPSPLEEIDPTVQVMREAIETLELSETVAAGTTQIITLAPTYQGLPELELRIDPGIMTLANGTVPVLSIDTKPPSWDLMDLASDGDALAQELADGHYQITGRRAAVPAQTDTASVSAQTPDYDQAREHLHDYLFKSFWDSGIDPSVIPAAASFGAHFVGARRSIDGTWDAKLGSSTVAGDRVGVLIDAKGQQSYEAALQAVAERYEAHAKDAFRHNQAPGICDSISVLRYLEKHNAEAGGAYQSELLTPDLRSIAAKGGTALNDYYEQLVTDSGATPSDSDIVNVKTINLVPFGDGLETGSLQLAQLASGHYVIGASIPLPGARRIDFEPSAANELYVSPEQAAGAFLRTVSEIAPDQLPACANALYDAVPVVPSAYDDIPDVSVQEAHQQIEALDEQIRSLDEQIRSRADFNDPQTRELIGQRDGYASQRAGYEARLILTSLQNNPTATLDLDPGYVARVASQYRVLREAYNEKRIDEIESGTPANQALRELWLNATGFDRTHEVSQDSIRPRSDISLPDQIDTLEVIERSRNSHSDPVYLVSTRTMDNTLAGVLSNQARLSGAMVVDDEIVFSSLEQLEQFTEENTLRFRVTPQVFNDPDYNTEQANSNLSPAQAKSLHQSGYIQTEVPHTWLVSTDKGASVSVAFYRGIDGETLDANVKVVGDNWRHEEFLTELPGTIQAQDLTDRLNVVLQAQDQGTVMTPAPEPAIATISGEKACAMVLSAGLNIEYRHDPAGWLVSGDSFAYRQTLYHLGGKFHRQERGRSYWEFKENPVLRLGAALASRISSPDTAQNAVDGYILTVGTIANDNQFVVRAHREGDNPDRHLVISSHSALSQARTSTIQAQLEPGRLEATFEKAGMNTRPAPNEPAEVVDGSEESASQTPQEAPNAHANERPSGTTPERAPAGNAAGTAQRQPRVDGTTGVHDSGAVAGQSRGAAGTGGRSSGGPGSSEQERPARTGGSTGTPESTETSLGRADGRVIGDAEPRELFDLNAAERDAELTVEHRGQATLDALELLLELRQDKRTPSDDEKQVLARFVGLGASQFNGKKDGIFVSRWKYENDILNDRIAKAISRFPSEEQAALQSTVLTAFFTPPALTGFMWQGLEKMGVNPNLNQLDMVEPAAGTGHFIGQAPEYIRNGARVQAIECDPITAEIATHLYPEAQVINRNFQDVQFPANSKDLFIGNPPYSDVRTYNPATGQREVIHDLFLRESIKATRPGGMVAFVTSSGTLDKKSDELRRFVSSQADLVHAVRLPVSAFKDHAGTEVMTDILYFRKRQPGEPARDTAWIETVDQSFEFKEEPVTLPVNQYFVENPQNVLGSLKASSGRFGPTLTCEPNGDLQQALDEQLAKLPEGVFSPVTGPRRTTLAAVSSNNAEEVGEELMREHRIGNWYQDALGEVRIIQYDGTEAKYFSDVLPLKPKQQELARDYIALRDAAKALIEAESQPQSETGESEVDTLRASVNGLYDGFVQKHGPINRKATIKVLRKDPDAYFVAGLEHYDRDTDHAEKADILKQRVIRPAAKTEILTPEDAMYASMSTYGHIDPAFAEQALAMPWDKIAEELGDAAFLDPETGYYTTSSVYLSGDVIHKREIAERALVDDPTLERNVEALRAVTPKAIPVTDIHIKLGATWMPDDMVQEFARTLINARAYPHADRFTVKFNDLTKSWQVKATDALRRDRKTQFEIEYGTKDVPFHKMLDHCLSQTRPKVYVDVGDGTRVLSPDRTQQACDKQAVIEEKFLSWILEDTERARRVQDSYNYRLNRFVRPEPDGRYLTFPGVTEELKGRPFEFGKHQLGVIERALTSPYGTLLAHEAGGGKTISTTAIAIKHKQLGLAKKPMVPVPNHMLVQFTREALELYPNARILTVTPEDMTREGRALFAQKCRLNDWDLVICTHSQYQRMSMPPEYVKRDINRQLGELSAMLLESDDAITTKALERQKNNLKEKLTAVNAKLKANSDDIDFTTLGVDFIGYDEGHYLKNMDLPTKNRGLAGVGSRDALRSRDSMLKFDWIRESRGDGKGVLLATGTPISNTVGEIMVMMRYLAPELLERAGIYDFDQFLANFGDIKTHLEITADGSSYQTKERLSGFRNIPELMRLFTQVADIKMGDDLQLKRPNENRVTHVTEMTPEQAMFMDWLGYRATLIKSGVVKPHEDNMLNIYTDLRKASVDMRLIHHKLSDDEGSKLNDMVETLYQRWKEGSEDLSTTLVFCDFIKQSTKEITGQNPKTGNLTYKTTENLNLYKDIKNKLIVKGVPEDEIAFIHDAKTDEEKEQLFEKMRSGRVRICLASTEKMGVGTNVQTRLKDLWHASLPMRSIDMEQRNKRAVRQGNLNDEVNLHYPVTKGSGDLASLQMLDRKEKMVRQIMYCDFENMLRSFDEDHEPTYEELMALTTNNPIIKEKIETDTEVQQLQRKARSHEETAYRARMEVHDRRKNQIPRLKEWQRSANALAEVVGEQPESFEMTVQGTTMTKYAHVGAAAHKMWRSMSAYETARDFGEYRGLPVTLSVDPKEGAFLNVDGPQGERVSVRVTKQLSGFPSDLARNVQLRVDQAGAWDGRIAEEEAEADRLEALASKPFEHTEKLEALVQKQAELNAAFAKWEEENKPEVKSEGWEHPFQVLLDKLDGKAPAQEQSRGALSDEEIQAALSSDEEDTEQEEDQNKGPNLTLV